MYLGIDIGTTSVKTVLVDETQAVRGTATAPLAVCRPQPGWSEQDPDTLVGGGRRDARLPEGCRPGRDGGGARPSACRARCMGRRCSTAATGAAPRDPLERRARAAECVEIEAACPEARAITGNIVMPGFTAPKLAWVRKHEPAIFDQVRKVLLPKDYVRLRLTGDYASDMSDASGTCWLESRRGAWSDALLAATGLDRVPHAGLSRARSRPASSGRPCGQRSGWIAPPSWRAAPATMRPRPAASAPSRPARPSCPSAPRACSSSRMRGSRPTRTGGPRLLPRAAGDLAPDGRHPVGHRQPELVRPPRRGPAPELAAALGRDRRRALARAVHALSVGRADAA